MVKQQFRSQPKLNINGVLLLDKPAGITSNKALQSVKKLFNAKKAGHTGSLDPLATGLLPICFGQATKVCSYLLGADKQYQTVIKLGQTTDTLDSEGEVVKQREVDVSDRQIELALATFRGAIKQIPPMFSALKKDGQPLYKMARKGVTIERPARDMFVHKLMAERLDKTHMKLSVHCSSGFYIRSLAYDLGELLGCGAHVVELRRTAIKNIDLSSAITLEELNENVECRTQYLLPIDTLITDMPCIQINAAQATSLSHGKLTQYEGEPDFGLKRFYDSNKSLFAIGEITPSGLLKTHKMFINCG